MIQLATALPAISVGPVKPNAAISADVSGFALAMGALMPQIAAPVTGMPGKIADAAVPPPEGQGLAETGKELPDAVLGLDGKSEDQPGADTDKDEDAGGEDAPPPPFAWFATTKLPVAEPEPKPAPAEVATALVGDAGGKARTRREIQLPETPEGKAVTPPTEGVTKAAPPATTTGPAPAPVLPQVEGKRIAPVARQPKPDAVAATPCATGPAEDAVIADAMQAEVTTAAAPADPAQAAAPVAQPPRELRKAAAEAPVVRITLDKPAPQQKVSIADVTQGQRQAAAAPAPQSVAEQVFAAFEQPQAQSRAAANGAGDPQVDLSTLAAQASGTQAVSAVAAAGQGQDAMLDTRHQQWTAKMIDRIEALQDAAPLRETRISLMPEGLGKVDIAIRQDDAGSLHVQFNTDTQAARQLIADAQPKLAEIAQERGIRIGSTSVESNAANGNGGTGAGANSQMNQGQQNDARPQRNQPAAPPSVRREAQTSTQDDERIA